jgi:hypothetical protein
VEKAAELVATADLGGGRFCDRAARIWRAQAEGAVRALGVVMLDVDADHAFEVAAIENQQPGAVGP